MSKSDYLYDPEGGEPKRGLTVGNRYQGTSEKDGVKVELHTDSGTVTVSRSHLIALQDKPRSEKKLERAADHVTREFRMLAGALGRQGPSGDAFAYTAWFLHSRNVMGFLEGKGHDRRDIVAQHFLPGGELNWHKARRSVPEPADLHGWRKHINRLTSHLTYKSLKCGGKSPAPSVEITSYLLELGTVFIYHLPPNRIPWFARALLG